jgi:hypothetical protein
VQGFLGAEMMHRTELLRQSRRPNVACIAVRTPVGECRQWQTLPSNGRSANDRFRAGSGRPLARSLHGFSIGASSMHRFNYGSLYLASRGEDT